MAANIDSMLYVGEKPWHGLGVAYDTPPKTSKEIIEGSSLDWTVSLHKCSTDLGDENDIYTIYRDDTKQRLGVALTANPMLIQNRDAFAAMDAQLGKTVDVETAASLAFGKQVFGCFKYRADAKVLDDEVESYFVFVNNHTVADGKVICFNTPIRVVCQNTLSSAMSSANHKMKIPVTDDALRNKVMIEKLLMMHSSGIQDLNKKAEELVKHKVDKNQVEIILDEFFPLPLDDDTGNKTAKVEMRRDTFVHDCMGADNLGNYRGTAYQVYNALVDYEQHYVANADKAYDLKYRMSKVPGFNVDPLMSQKFIKMAPKLVA